MLAELAAALRQADMLWPRHDDEDFVGLRALAWARCRDHLGDWPEWGTLPEAERAALIEDFVATAGLGDDDVTRSLADLFLDYGDGYITAGALAWHGPLYRYAADCMSVRQGNSSVIVVPLGGAARRFGETRMAGACIGASSPRRVDLTFAFWRSVTACRFVCRPWGGGSSLAVGCLRVVTTTGGTGVRMAGW